MGDSGLTYLGAFEILTEGLIEHADAYQEPDGTVRAVCAAGNQVYSIQGQRPAGASIYGAVYALGTTAGIRYVSRPVPEATFRAWVEAAAEVRAAAEQSARERNQYGWTLVGTLRTLGCDPEMTDCMRDDLDLGGDLPRGVHLVGEYVIRHTEITRPEDGVQIARAIRACQRWHADFCTCGSSSGTVLPSDPHLCGWLDALSDGPCEEPALQPYGRCEVHAELEAEAHDAASGA